MNRFPNRQVLPGVGQGAGALASSSPSSSPQAPYVERFSQQLPPSEAEIRQREALAQVLLGQGAAPGRIEHPLQGIAQLSNTALGVLAKQQADKKRSELRDVVSEFYANLPAGDRLTPEQKRFAVLLNPSLIANIARGEEES